MTVAEITDQQSWNRLDAPPLIGFTRDCRL
jgi:hypothetical protein